MMQTQNQLKQMPLQLEPGEIWFWIDLQRVKNMTTLEALKRAESLGFPPELRYRTWEKDGVQQVELCAVLHYEKRDYDSVLEAEHVTDEAFAELAHLIQPSTAVRFTAKIKHREMLAA